MYKIWGTSHDDKMFAERILEIIENKALRKKMSIAARYWAEGFDWQQSSDNFFAVINHKSNNDYVTEKKVLES